MGVLVILILCVLALAVAYIVFSGDDEEKRGKKRRHYVRHRDVEEGGANGEETLALPAPAKPLTYAERVAAMVKERREEIRRLNQQVQQQEAAVQAFSSSLGGKEALAILAVSKLKRKVKQTKSKMAGHGVLRVHVVKAVNLRAADLNGKSDPYVVVHAGGVHKQTHVVHADLNPQFDQTLEFPGVLSTFVATGLTLEVRDADMLTQADPLGGCRAPLHALTHGKPLEYDARLSTQVCSSSVLCMHGVSGCMHAYVYASMHACVHVRVYEHSRTAPGCRRRGRSTSA